MYREFNQPASSKPLSFGRLLTIIMKDKKLKNLNIYLGLETVYQNKFQKFIFLGRPIYFFLQVFDICSKISSKSKSYLLNLMLMIL
jgi:hypothetical protein